MSRVATRSTGGDLGGVWGVAPGGAAAGDARVRGAGGAGRRGGHGRGGGFLRREWGSSRLHRGHRDRLGGSVLAAEGLSCGLQSCQGERACGSQPEVVELARACAEGFPVLGTGLASALARGKRASKIGEEKRRMVFQPVVPGGRPNDNPIGSYL